jgi:hypothetical protein
MRLDVKQTIVTMGGLISLEPFFVVEILSLEDISTYTYPQ